MKDFSLLFSRLDQTNKTNEKVAAVKAYFQQAQERDLIWALALFTGRRPRRPVNSTKLREWAAEAGNLPLWLFEESYHVVGDLSETIAHLLPPPASPEDKPLHFWINHLQQMQQAEEEEKKAMLLTAWEMLEKDERFVFNKLMSSTFRVGISQNLITRALAETLELERPFVAHRLMGNWKPEEVTLKALFSDDGQQADLSRPYPFYLAYPLESEPESLGQPEEWQAEWKWDGIRAQLIRRGKELFIWSRGEELITDRFPEFHALLQELPEGVVLDGEILPYKDGEILSFASLQTRLGRKNVSKAILKSAPVVLFAYDLLEENGEDIRQLPLAERRKKLEKLIREHPQIQKTIFPSPVVDFEGWSALATLREQSREHKAEGFMLKRKDAPYGTGRKRGDWWKWKIAPLTIDGVLVYAQKGSGRRADLYTDYTFAVPNEAGELVPFAKAYSGLTDEEIRKVNQFIRRNTQERFGPVRTVKPELVFEIAFEGIQHSKRHKSGVALRFPRIARWRHDKPASEANTLTELQDMLEVYG